LQVDIERSLREFKRDACAGQLDDLLRTCLRLHAEMAHITTNLQYYINLEVVECESLSSWAFSCWGFLSLQCQCYAVRVRTLGARG
jgi:hypothetical protein